MFVNETPHLCSYLNFILMGLRAYLLHSFTLHKIKFKMFYETEMFNYVGQRK